MATDFPSEALLPQKTVFKKGSSLRIAEEALEFGSEGLIVHGNSLEKSGRKKAIINKFPSSAKVEAFCRGTGEPALDEIPIVIEKAKKIKAKWIAGIGGGSVLDLAKAAAGLFNAKEKASHYQEGGALKESGIPFIAVPTTAGTGSEATPNAVIINKEKKAKLSIRDRGFLARKVILDADLLKGTPVPVKAFAGMDAFVQAYEAYTSRNSTWFSDTFALKAIKLIDKNILQACEMENEESLSALLLGSYLAGIALASARLGVIHGIAHPLGVLYGMSHGLVCSACFIPSLKVNREMIGEKYDIMSGAIGMDLTKRVEALLKSLNISAPFKGKKLVEKEKIVEETLASGSTAANPKKITAADVESILSEMF
ncbi:MAG: iron-containing alcohol dehydrogenase [Candidatus Omnitrophica bacterium]|nr:iron-containing alcohol dehydrogenase [Candidatus Omnitrophota bacterium]